MAERVFQYEVTIAAGTLKSAPSSTDLDLDNWIVEAIDLEVPPGPNYLMGFAIFNNGVQWVPNTGASYFVWDDHQQTFQLTKQPDASGWQVVGYNTGTYDHTVTVRFHVVQPEDTPAPVPTVRFVTSGVPERQPVVL